MKHARCIEMNHTTKLLSRCTQTLTLLDKPMHPAALKITSLRWKRSEIFLQWLRLWCHLWVQEKRMTTALLSDRHGNLFGMKKLPNEWIDKTNWKFSEPENSRKRCGNVYLNIKIPFPSQECTIRRPMQFIAIRLYQSIISAFRVIKHFLYPVRPTKEGEVIINLQCEVAHTCNCQLHHLQYFIYSVFLLSLLDSFLQCMLDIIG